jgi:hypothetical protein
MKYRKKPVVIDATQWFKQGDHPDDYADDRMVYEHGVPTLKPGDYFKARGYEGDVVQRYRNTLEREDARCKYCGDEMGVHGWISTTEGGHIVCPGDWVITGVNGERYPCKDDVFRKTYDVVVLEPPTE